MKKCIVSGAAGFVGSAVVHELIQQGIDVIAIVFPGYFDDSSSRVKNRLDGLDIQIIECNIKNITQLRTLISDRYFDAYYNFAWDGLFGESLLDYSTQISNIKWVMDAIIIASELGCKKFVGAGTISQFELNTIEGQKNYSDKHKYFRAANLLCEYMGRTLAAEQGIQFYWPIITNIYGEGEDSPRLINTMIRNILKGKHQTLSEGNQIYDFIHISDAARAFYLIGEKGKEFETYIIGSSSPRPLKDFLCIIRDIINPSSELGFGELPFNGIYLSKEMYNTIALDRDTGFKPEISFEEGIRRTAKWTVENENRDLGLHRKLLKKFEKDVTPPPNS